MTVPDPGEGGGGPRPVWVQAASGLPGVPEIYGYETVDDQPSEHRGLPSPYLTFIVALEAPVEGRTTPEPAPGSAGRFAHDVLLGGLHTTPAYVHQPRRQVGVQMAVHPLAARRLFGLPVAALPQFTHEGREVVGREIDVLRARLEDCSDWAARVALTRDYLARRLAATENVPGAAGRAPRAELWRGWQLLAASGGTAPVGAVARAVGLSARQFTKLWTLELGLGPKETARLMRFDRAVTALKDGRRRDGPVRLADVAAGAGYTDQSHLVRDFRAFAGCPPSEWIARELRE